MKRLREHEISLRKNINPFGKFVQILKPLLFCLDNSLVIKNITVLCVNGTVETKSHYTKKKLPKRDIKMLNINPEDILLTSSPIKQRPDGKFCKSHK